MTNENNATQGKHLESLAAATKRYILAQILDVTDAVIAELGTATPSGSSVLDTVPATVNGGMWYELEDNKPVVKIYYGGNEYPLGSGALEPTLTVAPSPLNVPAGGSASATISCDSGGNYLVTSLTEGITAELVDNVITVNHVLGIEEASIKIRVMASSGFNAAEILLPVTMAKASPNLTVTPSANIVPCAGVVTAEVSYSGGGTISVSSDNANITPTYDVNTQTITVPYNGHETSATITVSLTASNGYTSDTKTFTVAMEQPVILTITPSYGTTVFTQTPLVCSTLYQDFTAKVHCLSNGTISVRSDREEVVPRYNEETQIITVPFYYNFGRDTNVTITVSVTADGTYPAASTSFVVTMAGEYWDAATPNLLVRNNTTPMFAYAAVALPFITSVSQDLCGGAWSTNGSPTIVSNNVLCFNGSTDSLHKTTSTTVQSSDLDPRLSIRFWLKINTNAPSGSFIFIFYQNINDPRTNSLYLKYVGSNRVALGLSGQEVQATCSTGVWHHIEVSNNTGGTAPGLVLYIDGVAAARFSSQYAPKKYNRITLGRNVTSPLTYFSGYIGGFKASATISHTADFTPPAFPFEE